MEMVSFCKHQPYGYALIPAIFCTILLSCAPTKISLGPLDSEQAAKMLKPGLAVLYFDTFVRKLDELPQGVSIQMQGRPGKPIPMLNHRFGENDVFDSGRSRGVGMHLTGYLYLSEPGQYIFKAMSNDGIRVFLNEKVILEDDGVHSDRFSEPGTINIDTPRWYPFKVVYFQRKGTATIELYWEKPGDREFSVIPAEAYGHVPE
jgi:hypothetical protein